MRLNGTVTLPRKAGGGISGANRPLRLQRLGWLAGLGGAFMIFLNYAPMLWLAIMSLSAEPMSGVPTRWTLEWYQSLFADDRWTQPLLSSIVMAVLVGIACAMSALVTARALRDMSRRWRGRFILALILPLLVPGVLMGAGLFIYLRVFLALKLGWWSVFVAHFVWAFPFALLALLIITSRFDSRLTEVAQDLGAKPWRVFWDIEFPILLPGIVSAAMFGFLFSFSELPRSVLLRGGRTTLPIFEWTLASAHSSSVPLVFALSTLELVVSTFLVIGAFLYLFGRQRS